MPDPDLRPRRALSLTEIEGHDWGPPKYESRLVTELHWLRHKPIGEFTVEDLRLVIG